jgi:YidC/Oxa1 family membrane protein insertase
MQQKRLLLALFVSTVILFGWNYLFPIKPIQPEKPSAGSASPQPTGTAQPKLSGSPQPQQVSSTVRAAQTVPHRTILIKTPLYKARLDNCGAVVLSWILEKNKESGRALHSVGGEKTNSSPLELVPQKGMEIHPREASLQLVTGDAAMDDIIASSNYRIEGSDDAGGDVELNLAPNEKKQLTLSLHDESTGLDVVKAIVIDANSYSLELRVKLKRGDQFIPSKLEIGPSIGDQGIKHYTFYSVAPEAIAAVGDKVERYAANSISDSKTSPNHLALPGPIDWAGVGDTYFAMVAIPAKKTDGLEYRTTAYDYPENGKTEKRYLMIALVPIAGDGSLTIIYVGPKDHYLLQKASEEFGAQVGRKGLDLDGLINYGFLGLISRPIAERLLWCIKKLYELTGSYGVAIILFTIIIYSAFFPLKWRSSKAMKKAQKLAPRMKELQAKIKGMKQSDPRLKELQMEQLRLMKEGNPLGGCLPLLIQMPFLFALYRAITISLDFRQASFLWLPDLSAPEPYFVHVLPILMAATMIVLQLITPAPSADPLQRKMMAIGMPLFMLYVLWSAPSGLLVYWLVGNIVGFTQQFLINRLTRSEDDKEPPEERPAAASSRKRVAAARVSQA